MFAFSLRKIRIQVCLVMIACTVMLTVYLVLGSSGSVHTSATGDMVCEFLSAEGIHPVPGSMEHSVYTVPEEFDKVMQGYNELQKSQGYDLSKYKNKTVEKYSYTVADYPGYENTDFIKAHVFVYGGEIIAGDICSVKLNGFMEGIKRTDGKDKAG